jgi:hypothetical protein
MGGQIVTDALHKKWFDTESSVHSLLLLEKDVTARCAVGLLPTAKDYSKKSGLTIYVSISINHSEAKLIFFRSRSQN